MNRDAKYIDTAVIIFFHTFYLIAQTFVTQELISKERCTRSPLRGDF